MSEIVSPKIRQPELSDFLGRNPDPRAHWIKMMPRRSRCIVPGTPHHITQRGVDRRETFSDDADRSTYLKLLKHNLIAADVRILAWCLMHNHVHLIAVPDREDSLAVLLRRVHGRYSQYFNARHGRAGHLWQNRYFACALGQSHLWSAFAYVENNPVRAGLVAEARHYVWSSAAAHLIGSDPSGVLDMGYWRGIGGADPWAEVLVSADSERQTHLKDCTYAGRPFGDESFVTGVSEKFGRYWRRGRPSKLRSSSAAAESPLDSLQRSLFAG